MYALIKRFWSETNGATAVEYGLVAGLIFLAVVATMIQVGSVTQQLYENIGAQVAGALS